MLNGKFYTGLPPEMIERNASNRNRLQSSLFWPDDTQVDSAVETRVKRRNSLQLSEANRPELRKQISTGDPDMNTKELFKKEFTKSSIQFYDNLQDNGRGGQARRQPLLRQLRGSKSDITPKPNTTILELPEEVVNESYLSDKKKQAFTSKIEFFDYADEGSNYNKRNNIRRPKMDMNDKKSVEKNSKNSPKLQVKRNVRNMSNEREKMRNDAYERGAREREREPQRHTDRYDDPDVHAPQRIIRNAVYGGERDEVYDGRRASPPRRSRGGNSRRIDIDYQDEIEEPRPRPRINRYDEKPKKVEPMPKKILKNPRTEERLHEIDFTDEPFDLDYIADRVRDVRLGRATSPKKHVTYSDETYENDISNYDDGDAMPATQHQMDTFSSRPSETHRPRNKLPNMHTGNHQQSTPTRQQQQQQQRRNRSDSEHANDEAQHEQDQNINSQMLNNNRNSNNNSNKSINSTNKLNNHTAPTLAQRKISPKMKTPSDVETSENGSARSESSPSTTDGMGIKKHLRSSLCFHGGEIVAKNDQGSAGADGGGEDRAASKTPTRRARNSATQRVSVGLPD